ncbi:hypothetical protein ACVW1C_005693 [Bradyrhizobium sp. USDA 4011]
MEVAEPAAVDHHRRADHRVPAILAPAPPTAIMGAMIALSTLIPTPTILILLVPVLVPPALARARSPLG